MNVVRTFAILAAVAIVSLTRIPAPADAATLSLVGTSSKICQLTGDTDWVTNLPTAAQTQTRSGLVAVDLGFPVDSGEHALFFLFGDSRPTVTLNPVPPDDALGVTTRRAPLDPATCLDLALVTATPGAFAHPTVVPPILQGAFNVPSGGIFVGDAFYAFFWTDHCALPVILAPIPAAPLSLPAPSATCPEAPAYNSIGRSVLARSKLIDPAAFTQVHHRGMPSGFVSGIPPSSRAGNGRVAATAANGRRPRTPNSMPTA
jgi:hypothetical protein